MVGATMPDLEKLIGERHAPAEAYEELISAFAAGGGPPDAALVPLLSELRRRRQQARPGGRVPLDALPAVERLIEAVEARLTARHVEGRREAVDRLGRRLGPLKQRLISHLAASPERPARLAEVLGSSPPTISRYLSDLTDVGLVDRVDVAGDGRGVRYSLTTEGQDLARDLVAHGPAPITPPRRSDDDMREYLRDALDLAVDDRRTRDALAEVADRIQAVIDDASERKLVDIEVDARREMLTTLRHARDWAAMSEHAEALERIARSEGSRQTGMPLAAFTHLLYERGMLPPEQTEEGLVDQTVHLIASGDTAHFLAHAADVPARWRGRRAWAYLGAAGKLRQQTRFGPAFRYAADAARLLEELDDAYGVVRARFQQGYCLRLRGHYAPARTALESALTVADEHGYNQFRADILAQLGDVLRCLGEYDGATGYLDEAAALADETGRAVTGAFALSARGAVALAEEEIATAVARFSEAIEDFEQLRHPVGLALSKRRLAVAYRVDAGPDASALEGADRLFEEAWRMYNEQLSPAGKVASSVGAGLLADARGDDLDPHVTRLIATLDRDFFDETPLLELDPSASALASRFAATADNPQLTTAAERLSKSTERKRRQHGHAIGALDDTQLEMGGEPRRLPPERHKAELALV